MLTVILITFATGVLSLVIANWNTYKYKKYPPGPLNLPIIGAAYVLGLEPHIKLTHLKRKYGNVIALNFGSYRCIVLSDYETIKKAFSLPQLQSRPKFEAMLENRGEDRSGIIWSTGKTNEEQHAFMLKTLKTYGVGTQKIEILLQEQLKILWETFDKQDGQVISNNGFFNTTAFGALWTIISGETDQDKDETFKDILTTTARVVAALNSFVYFFPSLAQIFPNFSGWNNLTESINEQNVYVTKSIESHKEFLKKEDADPRDIIETFLHKIRSTQDTTSTFYGANGARNMMCTIYDLLKAGTDPVSTCLSWFVAIAIRYSDVQNKMQNEVVKVIVSDRLPTLSDRPLSVPIPGIAPITIKGAKKLLYQPRIIQEPPLQHESSGFVFY